MMRRKLLGIFLLGILWGTSATAQLPDTFSGWVTSSTLPLSNAQIERFAPGDSQIIREYGFLHGEHRQYTKTDAELSVTLWRIKDATGAIGLYSFYRDPGTASLQSGYRVAAWPNRIIVQRGSFLVEAQGAGLAPQDVKLLMSSIPDIEKGEKSVPLLPAYLPEENLVPQSQKFVTGPAAFQRFVKELPPASIGFDLGVEAAIAEYKIGDQKIRFVMINYPTPQIAAKKLREFQQLPFVSKPEAGREVFAERKGPLVSFVLDSPSPAAAATLFSGIQYETQITWNQHVPTQRDNVAHLVITVFTLAGFVLLFAFVAGISFGGVRILAKKFLPFPIFDRPSEMEIIRLDLSGR